jgi:hypothetical protein
MLLGFRDRGPRLPARGPELLPARPDTGPRPPAPDAAAAGPSRIFLTTRRAPIFYLPITKCGCTWLKNLLYHIDHDREHPAGDRIHEDPGALVSAAGTDPALIRASRFAFVVLRAPEERLLSLYFDKIWGDGPGTFASLRLRLAAEAGLDLARDLDVAGHGRNLARLIEWLGANLAGQTAVPVNPHWRRQSQRLRRAGDIAPERLSLDGLGWQLPMLLAPAVPTIARRMQAVTSRNAAPRPVPAAALLTPELCRAVRRVYAEDAENAAAARAAWVARRATGWENRDPALPRPGRGVPRLQLVASHAAPLRFLPVPKCGSTWLRNLAYLLDHGRPHPDPLAIRRDAMAAHVAIDPGPGGANGFLVLRDPVDRFLSLYADKLLGGHARAMPWIAEALVPRGFRTGPRLSPAAHRANCRLLLEHIGERIARQGAHAVNPHWRPQTAFAEAARPFGLAALLLEELDRQLLARCGAAIPGLAALLPAVPGRNASAPPFRRSDLLTPALERAILAIYGPDRDLHRRVRADWAATGTAPLV